MRRNLTVVLAVLALLGVVAPPVFAQAPAPKVTIDGFLDQTTSWSNNMSIFDLDLTKPNDNDDEWYGRSRGQFQITGEIGRTKGYLKFEQDNTWGNVSGCNGLAQNCAGNSRAPFARRDGPLNTELAGNVEMLWIYTEFPLTGAGSLLPFVPIPGKAELGLQPWGNKAEYKLASVAVGQFGGLHVNLDLMPGVKFLGTYAQIDEAQTGRRDLFFRGDDLALLFSLEVSPIQGLEVKPMYVYYYGDGTAGAPRQGGRGGVADNSGFFPPGAEENRHTIGVDARWQAGPWSFNPTVLYQWGERDIFPGGGANPSAATPFANTCGTGCINQDISAWFLDFRGGWQSGPLQVEGLFLYTTGNDARDDLVNSRSEVNFYQAIDTYSGFGAGWGAITAIMHDYLVNVFYNAGGLHPGDGIGYDKYGRIQLAVRGFYSVTPSFKLRGVLTPIWTAEDVDTRSRTSGNGLTQDVAGARGRDNFLGTEIDFGFDWNFAPNISLYWIYGHLFAGDALSNTNNVPVGGNPRSPKDVDIMTAVVRYSF